MKSPPPPPPPPPPPFLLFLLFSLIPSTLTSSLSPPSPPHISPITSPSPTSSIPSPTSSPSSSSPTTSPSTPSPTTSPTHPSSPSSSTLDPKQLRALQSLNIPTAKDPCTQPSLHNATLCDSSTPFRHLLSLRLINCSDDVSLSITALKSLSTLRDLQFINCPISPVRFPSDLTSSLRSFTCIHSLRKLTGVWLSRLENVTDLTVTNVPVNASGPTIILAKLKKLRSVTISQTNLTGFLPQQWDLNLTHIDLSGNRLKGRVHTSLTLLEDLQILNLSSNELTGEIPTSLGDLLSLKNVSLASNSLSGPIPDSMSAMKSLVHIDLSSNQLNGTIPKFISELKELKYLNLGNNEFHGIMPFNGSFIKRLAVFKIGGNSNLCYNHSTLSAKVKLGIAPCDKHGLPMSPPPAKESPGDDDGSGSDDDYADSDTGESNHKDGHHHGPSKIVLGVAIGLSSIVFLIIFLILLSKWCH